MFKSRDLLIYLSIICHGDTREIIHRIEQRETFDEKDIEREVSKVKCKTITIIDRDYPEALKSISLPPIVLFYLGDISLLYDIDNNISVVGSRKPSEYGTNITAKIVKDLSRKYCVVSGMAKGIDAVAHETTLNNKGKTIAVLGSGVNVCWPPINKGLYQKILAKGLVISEYPPDTQPLPGNFPMRNRIIAALGKSLLVTDASIKSGTSITVFFALEQGKDVFCVPHPVSEEPSGCNAMIKEGAILVESAEDIFYYRGDRKLLL